MIRSGQRSIGSYGEQQIVCTIPSQWYCKGRRPARRSGRSRAHVARLFPPRTVRDSAPNARSLAIAVNRQQAADDGRAVAHQFQSHARRHRWTFGVEPCAVVGDFEVGIRRRREAHLDPGGFAVPRSVADRFLGDAI